MKKNNPIRQKLVRLIRPLSSLIFFLTTFDYKISIRIKPKINGVHYPYISTSAVKWLMSLNLKDKKILEFGSGYSSIFFCERGAKVYAVERDNEWKERINCHLSNLDKNITFVDGNKLDEVGKIIFDIIFIDDNIREQRLSYAIKNLKEEGIIIFDNSERYPELMNETNKQGFLIFNFWGNCADTHKQICTSVMLKNKNFKQTFLEFDKFIYK